MTVCRYVCDECGRQITKTHRFYRNRRYCTSCYKREFRTRICSRCECNAPILRTDPTAVCRKCEHDQPCVRCGKADYSIGKITPYGPVCNACSPYFRKQEPCEVCGALSSRLSRSTVQGHNRRMCSKCFTADHGTCKACKRHRKLQLASSGQMLCRKCVIYGAHPCNRCGQSMPAGYGNSCEHCYWRNLLEKRVRLDCAAFSTPVMAEYFMAFGQWLVAEVGGRKAALTIHRYLPFFIEIEQQWGGIPEYVPLLRRFGVAGLRRVLLPMRWIETLGLATRNEEARIEDSERRRITAIQNKLAPESDERKLLNSYLQVLLERLAVGKTTLRSVRLALTPAADFLGGFTEERQGSRLADQQELNAYLAKKPGQRAAVSGFVRYLREVHGAEIRLPSVNQIKAKRLRRENLEAELLVLIRDGNGSEYCMRQWLSIALVYFHGLDRKIGKKALTGFVPAHGGVIITWNRQDFWLPVPAWWVLG